MSKTARKHHYVPQFHLAGFTNSGRRKDYFFVFDLKLSEVRRSRPMKVAAERDYYKVSADGYPPEFIEGHFSLTESAFAPLVAEIDETRVFPKGTKYVD